MKARCSDFERKNNYRAIILSRSDGRCRIVRLHVGCLPRYRSVFFALAVHGLSWDGSPVGTQKASEEGFLIYPFIEKALVSSRKQMVKINLMYQDQINFRRDEPI